MGDSIVSELEEMLEDGIRLLVMTGDTDGICPWQGQVRWMENLKWKDSKGFKEAKI